MKTLNKRRIQQELNSHTVLAGIPVLECVRTVTRLMEGKQNKKLLNGVYTTKCCTFGWKVWKQHLRVTGLTRKSCS